MARTVPSVRQWIGGEISLGAYMNAIAAWLRFWQAPPLSDLRQTVAQSLATSTWTAMSLDTEVADRDGEHSTVTNTTKYIAAVTGWRIAHAGASFAANNAGIRGMRFAVDGVVVTGRVLASANPTDTTDVNFTRRIFLTAGQALEVQIFQNTGGALSTAYLVNDKGGFLDVGMVSQ